MTWWRIRKRGTYDLGHVVTGPGVNINPIRKPKGESMSEIRKGGEDPAPTYKRPPPPPPRPVPANPRYGKGVTDIYRAGLLPSDAEVQVDSDVSTIEVLDRIDASVDRMHAKHMRLREAARNLLASAPRVSRESPSGTVSVRIADMLDLQEALGE